LNSRSIRSALYHEHPAADHRFPRANSDSGANLAADEKVGGLGHFLRMKPTENVPEPRLYFPNDNRRVSSLTLLVFRE
jgi:hypothetical protein